MSARKPTAQECLTEAVALLGEMFADPGQHSAEHPKDCPECGLYHRWLALQRQIARVRVRRPSKSGPKVAPRVVEDVS